MFIDNFIEAGEDRVHAGHSVHDIGGRHCVHVGDFSEENRHTVEGLLKFKLSNLHNYFYY